ncbi:cytochrome c-type biogenesis protein [Ferrimonas balearica]|uniref:cytochrome c-type biogenesis protein n=1 Tax=Ferrimonas balearica TaxID=44012 RepID=UPI001C99D1A8|nr:cytochrome c-type biogenesis protein [Ferrimonas balearica]MBY5994308.1 cytochrome c-type biogenesis protein CcmH [Ferrimonas balearica]
MKRLIQLLAVMVFAGAAYASPIDTYEFKTEAARERGVKLAAELRCPQCQNQNLHDSNSPIAMDMRLQVYQMVEEGKSNDEIVTYFTDRYGDFVRYRPGFDARTYVLWLGPLVFFVAGAGALFFFVRKQRRQAAGEVQVTAADEAKLAKLLDQDQNR